MDKRALFLVPVGMALLGLLLIWLGWVPGDSPGAPLDLPARNASGTPAAAAAEDAAAEAERDDAAARGERRREHARVQDEPDGTGGGETEAGGPSGGEPDAAAADADVAYATTFLLRHRDAAHREKMRIVWADAPPSSPPKGAEVLLVEGYSRYVATRIVWDGEHAAGTRAATRTHRRGRPVEAPVTSHAFDVDPAEFARAWRAALLVDGARAERKEPPPEGAFGAGFSSGSHTPSYWVRLRTLGGDAVHRSVTRGSSTSRGIRHWPEIQNRTLYDVFASLVPERPAEAPLQSWVPAMTEAVTDATAAEEYDAAVRVLLEIALPVLGEAGGREALAAVGDLEKRLVERARDDFWELRLREACELARARIELRLDWSPEAALRIIRESPREPRWRSELVQWTRERLRAQDPALYRDALREDLALRYDDAALVAETLAELRADGGGDLAAALEPALASEDPGVRVSAALALLDEDPGHRGAVAVLDAVASDTAVHGPTWQSFEKSARARAVERLVDDGHWDAGRLRRQFAAAGEGGLMLQRLDLALERAGDPLSDVERREGYRRALESRPDRGMLKAMERLLDLDDIPSYDRIAARLARYATPPEGEEDLLDRWARDRLIPALVKRLGEVR